MARKIRGLESLKKTAAETASKLNTEYILEIESYKIKESPFNKDLPMTDMEELAASLEETGGPIESVIVYDLGDGTYELLSGHRRRQAWCDILGHNTIVCRVRPYPNDPIVRFREHAALNIESREREPFFWIAEIKNARELLIKTGFSEKEMEIKNEIHRLLGKGASPQQIARYEGFVKLDSSLQNLVKYGLSVSTLYGAVKLTKPQQREIACAIEEYVRQNPDSEITREQFNTLVKKVKTDNAERKVETKSYKYILNKAGDAFLRKITSAKKADDKSEALKAIAEMRLRLDEIEEKLR